MEERLAGGLWFAVQFAAVRLLKSAKNDPKMAGREQAFKAT